MLPSLAFSNNCLAKLYRFILGIRKVNDTFVYAEDHWMCTNISKIYKGIHKSGKNVAVKEALEPLLYKTEKNVLSQLVGNPMYVQLYDSNDKHSVLCLEMCEGGALIDFIIGGGEYNARKLFKRIVEIVHDLHSKGFAHCDLKLDNILIRKHVYDICLADFGLCKQLKQNYSNECVQISKEYVAPEVYIPSFFTEESLILLDIWTLGHILHALLLHKRYYPQKGYKDDGTCHDINAVHLLENLIQVNPAKRYHSTEQILAHPYLQ